MLMEIVLKSTDLLCFDGVATFPEKKTHQIQKVKKYAVWLRGQPLSADCTQPTPSQCAEKPVANIWLARSGGMVGMQCLILSDL